MSTKFVTITGADLSYFTDLVQQAIRGSLGNLTEVVIEVSDNDAQISTNGYTSSSFGTVRTVNPDAPASVTEGSIEIASATGVSDTIDEAFPNKAWQLIVTSE